MSLPVVRVHCIPNNLRRRTSLSFHFGQGQFHSYYWFPLGKSELFEYDEMEDAIVCHSISLKKNTTTIMLILCSSFREEEKIDSPPKKAVFFLPIIDPETLF